MIRSNKRIAAHLLKIGRPTGEVAFHLEKSAKRGDLASVAFLRRAGEEAAAGAPTRAIRWFSAALRLVPETESALRAELSKALGESLSAVGRPTEALATLEQALSLMSPDDPDRVSVVVACAELERQLGRYEDARSRLHRAMLKRDDMASTAYHMMNVAHPVVDLIDPERIGALGHCLGGNAAVGGCQSDPRCLAAVNLDGAIWTEVGKAGLTKPAMVVAAEHPEMLAPPEDLVAAGAFPTVERCVEERNSLFGGWQRVVDTGGALSTIEGASHANFSDVQFVSMPDDSPMRRVLGHGLPAEIWRRTNDLLLLVLQREPVITMKLEEGRIELKVLALTLWAAALVWIVLVLFGAVQFQELYGGSSGLQAALLGLAVGAIPAALGWWAYRRSR